MRKTVLSAFLALGVIVLVGCGGEGALKVGDPAPEFTLKDSAGAEISLSEYRDGGPALLYFHMAVG